LLGGGGGGFGVLGGVREGVNDKKNDAISYR